MLDKLRKEIEKQKPQTDTEILQAAIKRKIDYYETERTKHSAVYTLVYLPVKCAIVGTCALFAISLLVAILGALWPLISKAIMLVANSPILLIIIGLWLFVKLMRTMAHL